MLTIAYLCDTDWARSVCSAGSRAGCAAGSTFRPRARSAARHRQAASAAAARTAHNTELTI